ncbi:MAG: 30S ribosomal protein S8 [archaeon]
MSQDIVADALNQIMNAKKAGRNSVTVNRHSKLLLKVLEVAKKEGYIDSFETKQTNLRIDFTKINFCKAIKPRFNVKIEGIDKYIRRYLPSRNFGVIIISTSQGLMVHQKAYEKNLGGSLIAYFY